ncbi:MAG: DUF1566 domain-containing protein, partial [Gammaproteobacteria bacterium]|nr:DUF1566 domain-containing protein [Gammaproteobacteria bacterium]
TEWVRLGRGTGGLLDATELPEAERWLNGQDAVDLGYDENLSAFVRTSREVIQKAERKQEAARQRELQQSRTLAEEQRRRAEEQARASSRLRRLMAGLMVVFLLAAGMAVFAFIKQQEAEKAQAETERAQYVTVATSLAANARRQHIEGRFSEQAALLARQAYLLNQKAQDQEVSAEVREVLQMVLSEVPESDDQDENFSGARKLADHERVCQYVQRNLSWPEWQQFVLLFPYERTCSQLPVHFSVINRIRELRLQEAQTAKAEELSQLLVRLDPEFPRESATGALSLVITLRNKGLSLSFSLVSNIWKLSRQIFDLADLRPETYIVNDFDVQGEVVVDHATGLMWQQSGSDDELTYEDAQKYIEKLNQERFAGYDDWRLPTVPELLSLLEPEESS